MAITRWRTAGGQLASYSGSLPFAMRRRPAGIGVFGET